LIADRRRLVEAIFLEAAELPERTRGEFLSVRCAGDTDLQREVESLLGAHDADTGLLDEPQPLTMGLMQQISGLLRADDASIPPSGKIGAYKVIRVLGSGGMGVVYLAEQERPKRTVALKVIRRGLATASLLRRFEHEAEILGRLHHPGIAQIYEAGVSDDGFGPQPFIAMEYIDGRPLTEHAAANKLGVREKLVLMARVCDAVQHAHQRGVIHRDLKPGNILVQSEEGPHPPKTDGTGTTLGLGVTGIGQPKILDFGVARLADERLGVTTMGTNVGQLIGTLAYMSPEQLGADAADVDTRSDVYALGVVLFQLLAEALPYNLGSRALPEAVRMVRDDAPVRLGTINREFRGDLETIVSKATDKNRDRRYQSAAELAQDIHRSLLGEAIAAKRDSALYVIGKQLRRYKWAAATAAAFVLLLAGFAIYASYQATEKGRLALQERRAKEDLIVEQEKLQRTLYSARIGFAQAALSSSDAQWMRRELEACPERFRGWEWNYLARLSDTSDAVYTVGTDYATVIDIAPLAGLAAATIQSAPPRVLFRDLRHGAALPAWVLDGAVNWTLLPPDASWFAMGTAGGRVEVYDLPSRRKRWDAPAPQDPIRWSAAAPDASLFVTGGTRTITVWDAHDGSQLASYPNAGAGIVAGVSPDASLLATGSFAGEVVVLDLRTGEVRKKFAGHTLVVRSVAFSADSKRLASTSSDKSVRVWDLVGDAPPAILWPHTNKVWCATFTPDGKRIISGGTDSAIRVTDVATGEVLRSLLGHSNTVTRLALDPETNQIYSASLDLSVRQWSRWDGPEGPSFSFANGSWLIAASPDRRRIFVGMNTRNIGVIDAATMKLIKELPAHRGVVRWVAPTRDGKRLFSVGNEGDLIEWDLGTWEALRRTPTQHGNALRVVLTPDESAVATSGMDGNVKLWDIHSGQLIRTIPISKEGVNTFCFSPAGDRLVTGGFDRTVRCWDRKSGAQIGELGGFEGFITSVGYTPDGAEIILTTDDGTVRTWDPSGIIKPRFFVGHKRAAYFAAFSPDGRRMVTGGFDNTARMWDPATGQELLTLRGHISSVFGVVFSHDGKVIYAVSDNGRLLAWDSTALPHLSAPLSPLPSPAPQ
jgi:WD40 repeat protein/serine/threonine protein kinase